MYVCFYISVLVEVVQDVAKGEYKGYSTEEGTVSMYASSGTCENQIKYLSYMVENSRYLFVNWLG